MQHFRFESAFSGGLQKLITSIRTKPLPKSDSKKDASSKKQSEAVSGNAAGTKRKSSDAGADDAAAAAADPTRDKGSAAGDKAAVTDAPEALKRQRKAV